MSKLAFLTQTPVVYTLYFTFFLFNDKQNQSNYSYNFKILKQFNSSS